MGIKVSNFGKTADGKQAYLYTVVNKNGVGMEVSNYGATLVSITVPDRNGAIADVLLGYDEVCDYEKGTCYFGACIGRNGNRMKNAEAIIGDAVFQMEKMRAKTDFTAEAKATAVFSGTQKYLLIPIP